MELRFEGPCPFLTCRETGPHSHPVCPNCGAVRFGNLVCPTCRAKWPRAAGRRFQPVPNTRAFSFSNRFYKRDARGGIRELGRRVAKKAPEHWLTREPHRIGYHCGTEYDFTPFYQDTRYPEKEPDGSNI